MLRQGLIITAHREYAQAMRQSLLTLGDDKTRVDIELDALRAMQLVPQQYELILLDTMLNSMDGLQLLVLMKQQAPASKFIIVSDALEEASRAQAYQNGADFFLKRPGGLEAFKKALEEIGPLLKRDAANQVSDEDTGGLISRIMDVVQTRCLSGDSVLLHVRSQNQSGDIFIHRGEIFHAQYPGKSGEGAFYEMSHWDEGLVRIKTLQLNHVPPRTIETSYQKLLARAKNLGPLTLDSRPSTGELRIVAEEPASGAPVPSVKLEAPPLQEDIAPPLVDKTLRHDLPAEGKTALPQINGHWKVNLMGELVEGSQMADPQRCAFITYFIYRKLADVAVALEVDYFNQMTMLGPHLQQVLVADNLGIRHAVFDAPWTSEKKREQYVKWCCEQSL